MNKRLECSTSGREKIREDTVNLTEERLGSTYSQYSRAVRDHLFGGCLLVGDCHGFKFMALCITGGVTLSSLHLQPTLTQYVAV